MLSEKAKKVRSRHLGWMQEQTSLVATLTLCNAGLDTCQRACFQGHADVINFILSRDIRRALEACDSQGATPFFAAVRGSQPPDRDTCL